MSFASIFSLDPKKFPYTKECSTAKRDARKKLQGVLFYDLVLTEVAQIGNPAKLYPPRNISDLRALHEAVEKCPVDLLKKQCCIYYVLRDWKTHTDYGKSQCIPENYCNLMDSYWHLDNENAPEAIMSLTQPGLTPNFATKIMQVLTIYERYDFLVQYVHTIQNALDTNEKVDLYITALSHVNMGRALLFSRSLADHIRHKAFISLLDRACMHHATAKIVSDFPFTEEEDTWANQHLAQVPGLGLETLILRLTMLGRTNEVIKLRHKFGGGRHDITNSLKANLTGIEMKLVES